MKNGMIKAHTDWPHTKLNTRLTAAASVNYCFERQMADIKPNEPPWVR